IKEFSQKVLLRKFESCRLGNLNITEDWECKQACQGLKGRDYGNNHIETIPIIEILLPKEIKDINRIGKNS
ncbi:hypothetical protein DBR06_SOUSAS11610002, partial [Sousa chinensis]